MDANLTLPGNLHKGYRHRRDGNIKTTIADDLDRFQLLRDTVQGGGGYYVEYIMILKKSSVPKKK